jgi:hypothetical protein
VGGGGVVVCWVNKTNLCPWVVVILRHKICLKNVHIMVMSTNDGYKVKLNLV